MSRNYNSTVNQTIKGKFVQREVVTCMSSYVDYILKTTYESHENYSNAPFNYDDIENIYIDNSEEIEKLNNELSELQDIEEPTKEQEERISEIEDKISDLEQEQEEPQEVYEWWEVSSWLIEKLKEHGEVVIPHMNLWGRCATGQAILLDYIISEICEEMGILEGQEHSWAE